MQKSRLDLEEYIGESGYLFNSIDEISNIVKESPSSKIRERSFIPAQKSSIDEHIHTLFKLWKV